MKTRGEAAYEAFAAGDIKAAEGPFRPVVTS